MNLKALFKLKEEKTKKQKLIIANINYHIKNKSHLYKNIILDMDKTLIEGYFSIKYDKMIIEERPYLAQFFKFVFNHFEHVSIWTNGNKTWFDFVYETVLYKYIPKNKHFDFVITFDDGYVGNDNNGAKDLNVIFNIFEEDDYNKYNTFLVDDSETHFDKNPKNCYLIKPFEVNVDDHSHKYDIELLKIINIFRQ